MNTIEEAVNVIKQADYILIGAGAGMGVDSGMPDFRGNEGFWKAYPKFRHLGMSFSQMANPAWFENDPEIAWGFYGHRFNMYSSTSPHQGFQILLDLCKEKHDYFVFTSNVDGQFQKAGFDDNRIIECHGSIRHWQCTVPCSHQIWLADKDSFTIDSIEMRCEDILPRCPSCQAIARPNILMFGDWNWIPDRSNLQQQNFQKFLSSIDNDKLVILEFGAGTAIPTVRFECESAGGTLIRVNPREAQSPYGSLSFSQGALDFLKAIKQNY